MIKITTNKKLKVVGAVMGKYEKNIKSNFVRVYYTIPPRGRRVYHLYTTE
jgi:hypothetical protein